MSGSAAPDCAQSLIASSILPARTSWITRSMNARPLIFDRMTIV